MSDFPIATVIYGTLAILATFLVVDRLTAGNIGTALWPAAIAGFCIYRLATQEDE